MKKYIVMLCGLMALSVLAVEVGDKAPVLEAKDQDGKTWKQAEKQGGKYLVVYFYPAAMTGGCTKQACAYRDHLKKDLGNYMISKFKYETTDNVFSGVDFTTGWWFNRNLRIFRNIQKIPTKVDDRVLVIYGSSHMNLLNIFFDASPEYQLEKINDYLE